MLVAFFVAIKFPFSIALQVTPFWSLEPGMLLSFHSVSHLFEFSACRVRFYDCFHCKKKRGLYCLQIQNKSTGSGGLLLGINWILAGVGLPPPVWGGVLVGGKAPSHRRLQAKDGEAAGTVGGVEDVGEVRLQWCGRERPPPTCAKRGGVLLREKTSG